MGPSRRGRAENFRRRVCRAPAWRWARAEFDSGPEILCSRVRLAPCMLTAFMSTALLTAPEPVSFRQETAELRLVVRAVIACILREAADHADVEDCTSRGTAARARSEDRSTWALSPLVARDCATRCARCSPCASEAARSRPRGTEGRTELHNQRRGPAHRSERTRGRANRDRRTGRRGAARVRDTP